MTLARALLPLLATGETAGGGMDLDEATAQRLQSVVSEEYPAMLAEKTGEMHRSKLGLAVWDEAAETELYAELQPLMARSALDFTIFWRQLSHVSDADLAAADKVRLTRSIYMYVYVCVYV